MLHNKVTIAGYVATFCCTIQVIFQLCLAFGVHWSNAAWGGESGSGSSSGGSGSDDGSGEALPTELRVASAITALIWMFAAIIAMKRSNIIGSNTTRCIGECVSKCSVWFFTILFFISTILNILSTSPIERYMWAPFALLCTISFLILATTSDNDNNTSSMTGDGLVVVSEDSNLVK